nr:hypothetical protein [Nonomuraea sp. PA05]
MNSSGLPSAGKAALVRDQVDVLHHDDGRLQPSGQGGGVGDEAQRGAGHDHDGHARHVAHQVAHRVGLARAGRAVQQQAALEVLAAGQQRLGVPADARHVPFDGVEHPLRQDHLCGAERGAGQERHQTVAPMLGEPEREDLAAQHVVAAHQPFDLLAGGGGARPGGGEHLDPAAFPAELLGRAAQAEHDRRAVRRGRSDQAERHHFDGLVRAGRRGGVVDGADLQAFDAAAGRGQEVDGVVVLAAVSRHAVPGGLAPAGEVGVHAALEAGVLPVAERLRDDHEVLHRAGQVPGHPGHQGGNRTGLVDHGVRVVDEPLEGVGQ